MVGMERACVVALCDHFRGVLVVGDVRFVGSLSVDHSHCIVTGQKQFAGIDLVRDSRSPNVHGYVLLSLFCPPLAVVMAV
jgi:hypothetical protein